MIYFFLASSDDKISYQPCRSATMFIEVNLSGSKLKIILKNTISPPDKPQVTGSTPSIVS